MKKMDDNGGVALVKRGSFVKMTSLNSFARVVQVRIEFMSLGEVDTMNEKYQAEIRIKSRWQDEEEIDEYDKTKHWNPKLFIENALDNVREEITYSVTRSDGKSTITETRISKGSFWERIELQNFPLDTQELSIILASKLKSSKVKLVPDTTKKSSIHAEVKHTFRDQQKWILYKHVKTSEFASYDIGSATSLARYDSSNGGEFHQLKPNMDPKKSKLAASIFCTRKPGYYIVNCYLFILLITCLSLTLFAIETKLASNRISGTFTLILTSVSFKSNTNRNIPTVHYMTSLDRYQLINIFYLCLCCVWHSVLSSIDIDLGTKTVIDKIGLSVFAIVFLIIQLILCYLFYAGYKKIEKVKKTEIMFLSQSGPDIESDEDEY